MDKRCDYVQKFLAEWELQNRLFEILKPHRIFMTGFQIRKEDDVDLQRLPDHREKTSHTTGREQKGV